MVNNATGPLSDWTHNKDRNNNHLMWGFMMLKCSLYGTMLLTGTGVANDIIVSGFMSTAGRHDLVATGI